MSNLHDHEIAHLVDSLTPHQRVVLQRLVGECLTAIPESMEDAPPDWLPMLRLGSRSLFQLLDTLRRFENEDERSDIRPYSLTVPEPGHAKIALARRIIHWRGVWEQANHSWVTELHIGRLTVDVGALDELPSSVIAWLVTLANQLPEHRLRLVEVSAVMSRTLQVLRLNQVLLVEGMRRPPPPAALPPLSPTSIKRLL